MGRKKPQDMIKGEKMNTTKICTKCLIQQPISNFYHGTYPSGTKYIRKMCNTCHAEYNRIWNHNNPIKCKNTERNKRKRHGMTAMDENPTCPCFLGIHVAETLLSKVYKNVLRQPNGNKGFDFICDHGKKIDVKAACLYHSKKQNPYWNFNINNNKKADFFLCLAFDNRTNLNPIHIWLLPATQFNNLSSIGIAITRIDKWDKYKLRLDKIISCWDSLKPIIQPKESELCE